MKILLLNGYDRSRSPSFLDTIKRTISDYYSEPGQRMVYSDLFNKEVLTCLECQDCFVKTPGDCSIKDDHLHIMEDYMSSDVVIWIVPVTFGSFGANVTRVMERFSPLLIPSIERMNGWYRYKKRYLKYPKAMVIGILPQDDKEDETIFFELIHKNMENFSSENLAILLYEYLSDGEIMERLEKTLEDIGRSSHEG